MYEELKLPPQAIEIEQSVLGSLIVQPHLISEHKSSLRDSTFHLTANRTIYKILVYMSENDIEIDIQTLSEELKKKNQLDDIGTEVYLGEIAERTLTSRTIPGKIKLLVEKEILRTFGSKCNKISDLSFNENISIEDLLLEVEKLQSESEQKCDLINIARKRSGSITEFSEHKKRIREYKTEGFKNIGVSPGLEWPKFTEHYRAAKGMLNVVTGIPSHGKSEFVDAIMVNLALEKDWKWAIFTPENYPIELYAQKIQEKIIRKRFFNFTEEEFDTSFDFMSNHIKLIEPDEDNINVESILKLFDESINKYGVDGCVLDPWNEMDEQPKGNENTNSMIGRLLAKIRRFARRRNIYKIIVAHPTKMYKEKNSKNYMVPRLYDIADASNWYNKADNGISVYRNRGTDIVDIHIQKIKFKVHGNEGCVSFNYDRTNGCYSEYDGPSFTEDKTQTDMWQDKI